MSTNELETLMSLTVDSRGVARLILQRPDVHNSFNEALIARITEAFHQLGRDPAVRVVVLSSVGKSFCAGADIGWMQRAAAHGPAENLADATRFADMMAAISQCPKPVVARVQGAAYGGGVGLLCAADIAVASTLAKFTVSEARFGILPAVIGPYVVNAVGPRQARRLALTCDLIGAEEALEMGMVQHVVDADQLDDKVEKVIDALLRAGPAAQTAIKDLFAQLPVGPVTPEVRALTARTISTVRDTEEAKAGFAAFVAKRPAPWVPQDLA